MSHWSFNVFHFRKKQVSFSLTELGLGIKSVGGCLGNLKPELIADTSHRWAEVRPASQSYWTLHCDNIRNGSLKTTPTGHRSQFHSSLSKLKLSYVLFSSLLIQPFEPFGKLSSESFVSLGPLLSHFDLMILFLGLFWALFWVSFFF